MRADPFVAFLSPTSLDVTLGKVTRGRNPLFGVVLHVELIGVIKLPLPRRPIVVFCFCELLLNERVEPCHFHPYRVVKWILTIGSAQGDGVRVHREAPLVCNRATSREEGRR